MIQDSPVELDVIGEHFSSLLYQKVTLKAGLFEQCLLYTNTMNQLPQTKKKKKNTEPNAYKNNKESEGGEKWGKHLRIFLLFN